MSSNLTAEQAATHDVISDLWANHLLDEAELLSNLRVLAKQEDVEAMHNTLELMHSTELGTLQIETVAPHN